MNNAQSELRPGGPCDGPLLAKSNELCRYSIPLPGERCIETSLSNA